MTAFAAHSLAGRLGLGTLERVLIENGSGATMLQSFIVRPRSRPATCLSSRERREAAAVGTDAAEVSPASGGEDDEEEEVASEVEGPAWTSPFLLAFVIAPTKKDLASAVRTTSQLERVGQGLLAMSAEEDRRHRNVKNAVGT